eukprot:XP_010657268.1 PREDICTED: uncharacterized protein LOC104880876 [Vitis vinifera]
MRGRWAAAEKGETDGSHGSFFGGWGSRRERERELEEEEEKDGTGYGVACGGRWKQERRRDMRGRWAAAEKGETDGSHGSFFGGWGSRRERERELEEEEEKGMTTVDFWVSLYWHKASFFYFSQ